MTAALPLTLLAPTGLPGVTWLYALALGALAVFWWVRVAREARRGRAPRQAWWFVPGLLALLLAGPTELPALFGIGAALLLLAEYWPLAYARPRKQAVKGATRRPGLSWPLVGLVVALFLLSSALLTGTVNLPTVLVVVGGLVAGVGGLLSAALWPRPVRTLNEPGFEVRWQTPLVPEWPEFSLALTEGGVQLTNASPQPLRVAGWSPAHANAWLRLRSAEGSRINVLPAGQSAYLPLHPHESGLRVWYTLPGDPQQPRLFRADWTPAAAQADRVLN